MKKHLTILIFALFPQIFCAGALLASPLNGLTEAEQAYHDKIFDYVMDTVNPDQKYDWSSYSGKGSIEVGKPFVSKSRSNCREFTENYTVQGSAGKSKGYGCRRSNGGGWCRLKADEVLTCALERRGFSVGGGGSSGGGGSYSVDAPDVNMPSGGIGNVGSPNVNVNIDTSGIKGPNTHGSGNHGGNQNQQQKTGDVKRGEASDTAYSVTDTLGNGAAKGTGAAIGWFQDMFR